MRMMTGESGTPKLRLKLLGEMQKTKPMWYRIRWAGEVAQSLGKSNLSPDKISLAVASRALLSESSIVNFATRPFAAMSNATRQSPVQSIQVCDCGRGRSVRIPGDHLLFPIR